MKFSSEPPPRPYFCGEIETSRLTFSSLKIKKFDRDQIFLIVGPSGFFRRTFNRYTKRPLQDSAIIFSTHGMGESAFYCAKQITVFPADFCTPQGGKSTDFSGGKCHLLYFVVVPQSLKLTAGEKIHDGSGAARIQPQFK